MGASITEQVDTCRHGEHPRLVARVGSGWVVMSEWQRLPGYCVLLADPLVASLNELDASGRRAFLTDMASVGDALGEACEPRPRRINYEMLGNLDPTLHAHVIPRYEDERAEVKTKAIWAYAPEERADPRWAYDERTHGPLRRRLAARLAPLAGASDAGRRLWSEAAALAARAHAGGLRKDGATPYFAHPARVALIVRDVFGEGDAEALGAAFLHDVIEDTGTDYDDLAARCGAGVAALVGALSKDARLPEEERERRYDEALARADWRARLIKLADVLDNLSDVAHADDDSRERMRARARRALALSAGDRASRPSVARACEAVERALRGGG